MALLRKGVRAGCLGFGVILLLAVVGVCAYVFTQHGGDLDSAKQAASGLLKDARLKVDGLVGQGLDAPASLAPVLQQEGGAIEVYFAPCNPLNPLGIDDHLLGLLESASASIDCAFYELQLAEVATALIAKHREGVRVRVVSDSHYEDRDAVQECIRAGIPVVFDKRDAFMHDKFCIVDGRRVWTGSTNITENGVYRNNNNAVVITSTNLAVDFTNELEEMFVQKKFGARSPKNTTYPEVLVGDVRIECYFAPEDGAQRAIVDEIHDADTRIDFMAFSFTAKEIAEAMANRIRDGVAVRGLFEARNAGDKSSRDEYLAERGATIYMDKNKYTMHHKVIVIDADTVITGSYNFSASAEKKNDENVLIIHSPDIATQYTAEFDKLVTMQ